MTAEFSNHYELNVARAAFRMTEAGEKDAKLRVRQFRHHIAKPFVKGLNIQRQPRLQI